MDAVFEMRLSPVKLKALVNTKVFQRNVKVSDSELVIQGSPRVFIKCLSSVLLYAFIREAVGIGRSAAQLI